MFNNNIDLPEDSEFDEATDEQVIKFAHEICELIYEKYPEASISTEEDFALNDAETVHARQISIVTDLGAIVILPDFVKTSSVALVINLGMINVMKLEGFDDEYIEKNGNIFSDPIPFTDSSVEVLAYYLTNKIDIVT